MTKRRRIVLSVLFVCLGGAVAACFLWPKPLRPLTAEFFNELQGKTEGEIAEFLGGPARNYGNRLPTRQRSNMTAWSVGFDDVAGALTWKEWTANDRAIAVAFDQEGQMLMMDYYEFTETPWQMVQRLLHLD